MCPRAAFILSNYLRAFFLIIIPSQPSSHPGLGKNMLTTALTSRFSPELLFSSSCKQHQTFS
uniref:Uncharacterized protein n=1 Tax=Aegilops tauschii subsp. strangulata TaxID=200361 RepID=A0A453BDC4_AEGTS